ncbi:sentrin-specific protease 1-like isoform X2 [Ptychodera flava]|uniref:sentrin-specific protease 1-like isoform X2 n=1 Tax=Ptychodera flava TaxID=63121 RepID=UPI00396A4352
MMKNFDIEIVSERVVIPNKRRKSNDGTSKYIAPASTDIHMEGNGRMKLYGKARHELSRPSTGPTLDGSYLRTPTLPSNMTNHREKQRSSKAKKENDGAAAAVNSHATQTQNKPSTTSYRSREQNPGGFYPSFHKVPDKSVGGRIFSGNLTHRVHRQSPTLSYIKPRQYTVRESVRLEEKAIYQSLLQQYTNINIPSYSVHSTSQPRQTPSPSYRNRSSETELGSYIAPPTSAAAKVQKTAPSVVKVEAKAAEKKGKEAAAERQDLSHPIFTPSIVTDRSLRRRVETPSQPDFKDESLSITEVKMPETSARSPSVSSKKISQSAYCSEDWVKQLKAKYDVQARERIRKIEELEMKLKICQERRAQQEAKLEEQIRERMRISEREPPVLEDVTVAEEDAEVETLPELTEEMENEIDAAFVRNPGEQVLSEGFRLSITRSDVHTLSGLNWLNDEVINFYMNLLMDRGQKQGNLKVHAFNTFFYPKLTKDGYTSLRRWTRKVDIFEKDLVVVPVHLGMHWCLAVIDFRYKTISYYDSMGGENPKCLNALREYLRSEHLDKKKSDYDLSGWSLHCIKDIPQQMNGSDCGMFACKYAEYISRDAKITFSQDDMPYFRRRMVWEILHKQLL